MCLKWECDAGRRRKKIPMSNNTTKSQVNPNFQIPTKPFSFTEKKNTFNYFFGKAFFFKERFLVVLVVFGFYMELTKYNKIGITYLSYEIINIICGLDVKRKGNDNDD